MTKANIYQNAKRALNVYSHIKGEYDCITCKGEHNKDYSGTKTLYNVIELVRGALSIYISFDMPDEINIWTPVITVGGICKYYRYHYCIRTKRKVVAEWVAELCLAVAMVERDIIKG